MKKTTLIPTKVPPLSRKIILFAALALSLLFGIPKAHRFFSERELFLCDQFQELQKTGKPTFMLVTHKPFFGEREFLRRCQKALQNLGYPSFIQLMPEYAQSAEDYSFVAKIYYRFIEWFLKPNVIFCAPAFYVHPFEAARKYAFFTDYANVAHVYLHSFNVIMMAAPDMRLCPDYAQKANQTFIFDFYPTHPQTSYQESIPTKIYFGGNLWDEKRTSKAYKRLYKALDDSNNVTFTGPPKTWAGYKNYIGEIPFGGDKFLAVLKSCGIGLCLHSGRHLEYGTPTARIFELAAAGVVIICDKHPFVVEHFKDSVLYIDTQSTDTTLEAQVFQHLAWIQNNPKEAQEKAKKAYDIVTRKWTLEYQLTRIIQDYTNSQS
ncbi:MAG: glycosyltransferase family 1 protein [Alphaproteobacteria bacterium]|nr:glycosyltransferase family 1 protein [Alphaproteobacteria bacterium]OJV45298.1 MAG: hypothetical protein BGO28_00765 [Alphaproteobacteria bacterium 43-37]